MKEKDEIHDSQKEKGEGKSFKTKRRITRTH
jgi:hypothetical protein